VSRLEYSKQGVATGVFQAGCGDRSIPSRVWRQEYSKQGVAKDEGALEVRSGCCDTAGDADGQTVASVSPL
jgi:hypothetical protein